MCSEIPTVDLTGLHPSLPAGDQWEAAKSAVTAALHSHGYFKSIYPSLSPELRHKMFSVVPELFSLPLQSKLQSTSSEQTYQGYVGPTPHLAFESLRIDGADSPIAVRDFTNLMWPQGNPAFYKAAVAFVKPLQELAEIVQKMILQRLGVEEYYDEFVKCTERGIRISSYGVPPDQETKIGMRCHFDPNLLSIVCQHEIGGLEFQTDDGSGWINAEPTINSVYVIAGQAFQAWSNKSVRAPLHRVRMLGDNMRFSAIYATRPNRNFVKSLEELGDNGRPPMLFKPINYTEFTKFVMSSEQGLEQGPENGFNSYS